MRCLDLRSAFEFGCGHVAHAVHIDGLEALRSRFSTLPAPGVEFVVVCGPDAHQVANIFQPPARWRIAEVVGVVDEAEHAAGSAVPPHPVRLLTRAAFHAWADEHGGLRCGTERSSDDEPHLLFDPAPIIARTTAYLDRSHISILDVGCGAGRDLTYMLTQARAQGKVWRATALDRWRAALERARQLFDDNGLLHSHCDGIVCAKVSDDGTLTAELPRSVYDVVIMVRFWHVAFLERLPQILAPGGILVLSHFCHEPHKAGRVVSPVRAEYDSPPVDARMQPGDLERLLEHWNGQGAFCVVDSCIEPVEDGRPVHSIVIQRKFA